MGGNKFEKLVSVHLRKGHKAVIIDPISGPGYSRPTELTAFEADQLAKAISDAAKEARKP